LASGSVALCGLIGFVGFIVPHICRIFLGPKAKTLIFAGALAGAVFLVGAEVLNRLIFYPFQMPEGVLCSLCGAPFFLWVLLKGKGRDYDA
jgi:iron complex transport system permease protein